jgi:hypothetical protein
MPDESAGDDDFAFTPTGIGIGFALGTGFAVSMWSVFEDPVLAVSLGLSMGLSFALVFSHAEDDD